MNDLIENKFRIFTFRAIDEPELCTKYLKGHIKVLTDYGISNVSTNNSEWVNHPYIYCAVAEHIETKQFVGGVRIQISDGKHPLPVEAAVGYMDSSIYNKVKQYALNGGISESCGLWTAKSIKGVGMARYLMRSSISSSNQLGFDKMLGICGWHTLKLFHEIGFVVDKSLGDAGDFPYPTNEHIANVIGILDAVTLKNATEVEKEIMLSMRNKLNLTRTEINNDFSSEILYNLKYKNISAGPFLSEDNYDLSLIKAFHKSPKSN